MLTDFIEYLKAQIGEPYVWGGQHTKLTPDNYVAVIEKKETNEKNAEAAIAFCRKKFDEGVTVLYAYDCSGLGCYWLYNLMKIWKSDVNANTMMHRCKLVSTDPKRGYWLFKLSGSRATHIGYMVSDAELIEAKGRDYGVVTTRFRKKDWGCWGIPAVFEDEIVDPPAPTEAHVLVVGGSVNVRTSDSTKGRIMLTAHRGDEFPFLSVAPSGWYEIDTKKGRGFITNLEKYTKLEE